MNIDFYFFSHINNLAGKYFWLDVLAIFLAKYLAYFLVIAVFLFLLKNPKRYWSMLVKALLAVVLAYFGFLKIIHWFWYSPRPFIENPVNLLLFHSDTSSFPSGHAVCFFALSSLIYFYNKKIGIIFLIFSFLMGLARVFCGVHWPSDILAGAVIGIFSAWLIKNISNVKIQISKPNANVKNL
ncbi:phosphatase PAP2 family protein [Patescibacteria group bacterium]|nr:phosphatase PAP2 family protein [Patescibacteria group bacterium]